MGIKMFFDNNKLSESDTTSRPSYDICIIGAGAAGITIAKMFDGSNVRVCLLEGGGLEYSQESQDSYEGVNTALSYNVKHSRMRYFGGTTNHWTGYCSLFDASDFSKSWYAHSGWPIAETELSKYYEKASDVMQLQDSNFSPGYWDEKHQKLMTFKEDEVISKMTQFSPPVRFGNKYRKLLERSKNIDVYLNANVFDIDLSDDARSANGVKVKNYSGTEGYFGAKQVVLACGGIENARLLLNFRTKTPKGIGNQNDQVGRYFMEHLHLRFKNSPFSAMINKKHPYSDLYNFTPFSDKRPPLAMWQLNPEIRSREHLSNAYIHQLLDIDDAGPVADNLFDMHEKVYQGNSTPARNYMYNAEQLPNPASRVTLQDEKCQFGLNKSSLNWELLDEDLDSISRSLVIFAKALGKSGIGNARIEKWAQDGDFADRIEWGNHHIGTTRMSSSPDAGVVDGNCKIHGMQNIYVAGSSVFSTSGCIAPTFTIVALALRLANYLKNTVSAS
jgi:choline dehydrogenase-like flavoprotein